MEPTATHRAGLIASSAKIAPYKARFGRRQPLIAVVGENSGTELTDFVIPYGVLSRSRAAEVVSVATRPGLMKLHPALQVQPQASTLQFDRAHPEGADYVVVPAMSHPDDLILLAWIAGQAARGATIVSICDGALVVARTGLMRGRRATAHWATESHRRSMFPDVRWQSNRRYVADGAIVSSAGISAAMPVSLALVEAIAGHERAAALAHELGVSDWSPRHDSNAFGFGARSLAMYGFAIVSG